MPKNNDPTFVYNMEKTARRKCICITGPRVWLDHWERGTGEELPDTCCAKRCRSKVQVGAHVRIEGEDGRTPWIVPFCQYHNKRPTATPIELKKGVTLCGAAKVDCEV